MAVKNQPQVRLGRHVHLQLECLNDNPIPMSSVLQFTFDEPVDCGVKAWAGHNFLPACSSFKPSRSAPPPSMFGGDSQQQHARTHSLTPIVLSRDSAPLDILRVLLSCMLTHRTVHQDYSDATYRTLVSQVCRSQRRRRACPSSLFSCNSMGSLWRVQFR